MSRRYASLLSDRAHSRAKQQFRSKEEYEDTLQGVQLRLLSLQQLLHRRGQKVIVLLEGHDASGKGGVVKRMTRYLDPRGVRVHAIGKPNAIEKEEHYLERFIRALPQPGMITVFDRSWYGRVLVEKVEKLCSPSASRRAYAEINALEKTLQDDGVLILKYLLDLTHREQGRRFEDRKRDPLRSWKLTEEDWRNRKKWNQYHLAFKIMLKRTSTAACPWKVVASDSKWSARVNILRDMEARVRHFCPSAPPERRVRSKKRGKESLAPASRP